MIENVIRFIVDGSGNIIDQPSSNNSIRAMNNGVDKIVFISPFPAEDWVSVSFLRYNNTPLTQYLYARDVAVSNYVEEDETFSGYTFHDIADWNVHECEIKATALSYISKHRNGSIFMSFAVGELAINTKCITDKGYFGIDTPLPTSGQVEGDYYKCEDYSFTMVDNGNGRSYTFGRGQYIYWNGDYWVKVLLRKQANVPTVEVAVDPSYAVGYELDDDEINYLATLGADIVSNTNRIAQNENDIADIESVSSDNKTNIAALDVRVTQNESDINALDGRVTQNETDIGINKGDISSNLIKITALETANMFKDVSYNSTNGVITFTLFDDTTKTIDLPLELIVESGYYDEANNALVLVLANGSEIDIPVGDLLTDLDAVNIRYDNGDSTLVAVNVKTALDELDTKHEALDVRVGTAETNIATLDATKENISNKVTAWQETPDDTHYASEKLVKDSLDLKVDLMLDQPLSDLNGHSMREVFEDNNLVENGDFTDGTNNWSNSGGNVILDTNDYKFRPQSLKRNLNSGYSLSWITVQQILTVDVNDVVYLGAWGKGTYQEGRAIKYEYDLLSNYGGVTINSFNGQTEWTFGSIILTSQQTDIAFGYRSLHYDTDSVNLDGFIGVNLTALGIDLTKEQMDYYYNMYRALKEYGETQALSLKANIEQEEWIEPTLTSATSTYLKYRKDNFGTVIIEGNLTVTTAGTNFTLPTGYRPLFTYVQGDLTFNTDGTVVSSSTGTKYLSVRFTGGA